MPWEVEPQALRWHPAFETGVAAVDGGHRRVFAAAADALDAMVQGRPDDELIARVARLDTELHAHLLPEEAAWAAVDPTDALVQAHRASHQQVPPPERAASAADPGLAQTVQHLADALAWFCHHLLAADLPLADHLGRKRGVPSTHAELKARAEASAQLSLQMGRMQGAAGRHGVQVSQIVRLSHAMSDGLAVVEQRTGRVVWVNRALTALIGRPIADLFGRPCRCLFPEDAWPAVEAALATQSPDSASFDRLTTAVQRTEGPPCPASLSISTFEDRPAHLIQFLVFRDLSLALEAAKARQAAQTRFQTIFEELPGAVGAMDPRTQRVVLANRALGALLGSEPADLVGLALADMPPVEARVRVLEGFARATRGLHPGPARGMVLRRRDDGRPVRVDIQHRPVVVGGRPLILGLFAEVDEPAEAASEPFAAHHDPVTGLLNSAGFEQTCAARLHAAPERRFNLVRFDLDRFDELSLSDPTLGGELLRRVGERLQGLCPTCPAARVDGDEFLILQPADEAVDPLTQATRLLDSVFDEPIALSGNPIPLTAAAAVTRVGLHAGLDRATQRALRATLDEARLAHGPRIVAVGDATTSGGMTNKVATIAGGIVRREFVLHYQPKVRLDRDQVVGVEALVRWQHPDRGLLLPGQFLPDIAGTRLMRTLGEQLIEQTLDQMVAWARAGTPQAVAMNVSGDQLADHGFVRRLQEGLRGRPELDPRALQVEVLESSALDLRGPVVGHLHTLAQMGIGLAIDDFGTGYSSLALLQSLPVRTVKIDRSFVLALTTDVRQAVIVDGVLGMARGLMRQVVAEGVETETHGVRLIQLGCTTGQGFAIAHALPADALAAWARGWRRPAAWQTARAVARSRLRRLVLGWDHDIWRRAVLERLSMPPSAGLGDALPPSLFAEWRPTFRPSPELDALCAEHTHLRAQADALLATRPHAAELSPELRTFHAAAARFAARLAQTPALVEVDEPGEAGPNPWDTPAP